MIRSFTFLTKSLFRPFLVLDMGTTIMELAEDIKILSKTATLDNIIQIEVVIRKFHLFLQRIQSVMANEFAGYAKAASDLSSKYIEERGQSFQYKIPVDEIVRRWKETDDWRARLLSITHELKEDGEKLLCISQLAIGPKTEHSLIDDISTNIPTDDYYTMSLQQMLSFMAHVGLSKMMEIIRNKETLSDYLDLVSSAISLIVRQLNAEGERLQQDVEMFSALVQLVVNNLDINNAAMHGICYGVSMYLCAFSEKILRILYLHLIKDKEYIPVHKATFGELLVVRNTYIKDVFGENHIKNLSFFLQRTPSSNVGENIRNSLAHLTNVSTSEMTPFFVAKMLWIFTDILNTVFWYCLKSVIERNEENDDKL